MVQAGVDPTLGFDQAAGLWILPRRRLSGYKAGLARVEGSAEPHAWMEIKNHVDYKGLHEMHPLLLRVSVD